MELRAGESGGGCFACRALVRVQTPLTDHGSGFLFGCRCLSQLLHSTSFVLGRWIFINEFLDSKTPIQPQFYVGRVHAPKPRAGFSGTAVCAGEEGRGWVLFFFCGRIWHMGICGTPHRFRGGRGVASRWCALYALLWSYMSYYVLILVILSHMMYSCILVWLAMRF